jgi:hypothetical protein
MVSRHSATHSNRERFYTIFILVSIAAVGHARAQTVGWNLGLDSSQYAAPGTSMYRDPTTPTYRMAECPDSNGGVQEPVAPGGCSNAPGYQPSYPPSPPMNYGVVSNGWCDSSMPVGPGYGMIPYACPPPVSWGGYVGALMLNREDENHRFFSYDGDDEAYQLLDSQASNFEWSGGIEAHVRRMDACSGCGCEVVYWGLFPDESYAYAFPSQVAGDLNGIFNFDQLDYNGVTADNYVNDAAAHRLRRNTELHNIELNHLWNFSNRGNGNCCCVDPCSPCGNRGYGAKPQWSFQALAGFRYLRFNDSLEFASDPSDTMFSGEVDELYYNIDVNNDLVGVQFGGMGERSLGF